MRTTKRKALARTALELAIPPKKASAIARWCTEALAGIERQRPTPIPGACAVSVVSGIGGHDPLAVANELTRLLREAGILTGSTMVSVAARIGADVRRHHAERQTAIFRALRALRSTAGAAA